MMNTELTIALPKIIKSGKVYNKYFKINSSIFINLSILIKT